jgi:hypothetical protein
MPAERRATLLTSRPAELPEHSTGASLRQPQGGLSVLPGGDQTQRSLPVQLCVGAVRQGPAPHRGRVLPHSPGLCDSELAAAPRHGTDRTMPGSLELLWADVGAGQGHAR